MDTSLSLMEELESIPDEILFKDVKETDWVSEGISETEKKQLTQKALNDFEAAIM